VTRPRDGLVQIACDESGYEGEKLIGGMTDVFAHASVRVDGVSATLRPIASDQLGEVTPD